MEKSLEVLKYEFTMDRESELSDIILSDNTNDSETLYVIFTNKQNEEDKNPSVIMINNIDGRKVITEIEYPNEYSAFYYIRMCVKMMNGFHEDKEDLNLTKIKFILRDHYSYKYLHKLEILVYEFYRVILYMNNYSSMIEDIYPATMLVLSSMVDQDNFNNLYRHLKGSGEYYIGCEPYLRAHLYAWSNIQVTL